MGRIFERTDWNRMIFVGGISGTGKTTAIARFVSRHPDFLHLSASKILRNCDRPIRNLSLQQLGENQIILRRELTMMSLLPKAILDGHLTMKVPEGAFLVPASFFHDLRLSAFVLFWAEARLLLQRSGQPVTALTLTAMEELQDIELKHMHHVAAQCACPMVILDSAHDQLVERTLMYYGAG